MFMGSKNPLIDEYISNARPFARPILKRIRKLVHKAHSEINEELKWSFPNFTYRGKIICHMAAFKEHCAFGFWFSSMLDDPDKVLVDKEKKGGMGSVGRLTGPDDLPDEDVLAGFIMQSLQMVDQGMSLANRGQRRRGADARISVPTDLKELLNKNKVALNVFNNFSNTHRKEYIQWVEEAKADTTRQKRLKTALEWISEGKPRNWKYMKKKQ
jgi:uncharacterized protein YdeI (YjbR/CyaY-like superfamily)